jgi:hypothetical protein
LRRPRPTQGCRADDDDDNDDDNDGDETTMTNTVSTLVRIRHVGSANLFLHNPATSRVIAPLMLKYVHVPKQMRDYKWTVMSRNSKTK